MSVIFDKYSKFGAYHWKEYKQKTTYGMHARKVAEWVTGDKVLDIGAGDGLIMNLLLEKGLKCIGIDDNEIAIRLANERGISVQLGNAYHLDFPADSFNSVLMADTIEHLEYPADSIHEVYRVLKSDGTLYITTPPKKNGGGLHDKYHFKEYSSEELADFIEPLGFILEEKIENKYVRLYAKFRKK